MALEGQLLTHYKALLAYRLLVRNIKLKLQFLLEMLAMAKKTLSDFDLPILHAKEPSRLNNMNSQGYIKLSRIFHLLPIWSYLI